MHISERMKKDKVTINEEISTVEDACTVFIVEEDVKEESTEDQGFVKHFTNMYIYIHLYLYYDF